jgi:hypothetical protein
VVFSKIFQKNSKHFLKNIFLKKINFPFKKQKKKEKTFCLHAYDQFLKTFQAYFHKKKLYLSYVLKKREKDIITSL